MLKSDLAATEWSVWPARPWYGLFAVSEHHFIIIGDVLLYEVEGTDWEGLGDELRFAAVATVKGHEEAQTPQIISLIVLLTLFTN